MTRELKYSCLSDEFEEEIDWDDYYRSIEPEDDEEDVQDKELKND